MSPTLTISSITQPWPRLKAPPGLSFLSHNFVSHPTIRLRSRTQIIPGHIQGYFSLNPSTQTKTSDPCECCIAEPHYYYVWWYCWLPLASVTLDFKPAAILAPSLDTDSLGNFVATSSLYVWFFGMGELRHLHQPALAWAVSRSGP